MSDIYPIQPVKSYLKKINIEEVVKQDLPDDFVYNTFDRSLDIKVKNNFINSFYSSDVVAEALDPSVNIARRESIECVQVFKIQEPCRLETLEYFLKYSLIEEARSEVTFFSHGVINFTNWSKDKPKLWHYANHKEIADYMIAQGKLKIEFL